MSNTPVTRALATGVRQLKQTWEQFSEQKILEQKLNLEQLTFTTPS